MVSSLLAQFFVIAGCGQNQASDQNANNAQQAQAQQEQKDPNNIAGEWESVYELDSLQKAFSERFKDEKVILMRNSLKPLKTSR